MKNMDPLNDNIATLLHQSSDKFVSELWKDGTPLPSTLASLCGYLSSHLCSGPSHQTWDPDIARWFLPSIAPTRRVLNQKVEAALSMHRSNCLWTLWATDGPSTGGKVQGSPALLHRSLDPAPPCISASTPW
jgi:hypothetical protein